MSCYNIHVRVGNCIWKVLTSHDRKEKMMKECWTGIHTIFVKTKKCCLLSVITLLIFLQCFPCFAEAKIDSRDSIQVEMRSLYKNGKEYASVIAKDSSGKTIWSYFPEAKPASQPSNFYDLGIHNNLFYFGDAGVLKAFDKYSGKIIWENSDAPVSIVKNAYDFDEKGTLYISGYFGPDLCVISKDGITEKVINSIAQYYKWPYAVEYLGDKKVKITYENMYLDYDYSNNGYSVEYSISAAEILKSDPEIIVLNNLQGPTRKENGSYTWQTVSFGSYPQAEVIPNDSSRLLNSIYLQDGDYIIDADLYARLQSGDAWNNNEKVIDGVRYKRATSDMALNNNYPWNDDYHYFMYEPIIWRVLSAENSEAVLLADKVLDNKRVNDDESNIWAHSDLRYWLNTDFYMAAFSSEEQKYIIPSTNYTDGYGDTSDNVYLLSTQEALNSKYGFETSSESKDKGKRSRSTTFAKAMGCQCLNKDGYVGNASWWLRSPGTAANKVLGVYPYGNLYPNGYTVNTDGDGIRPVIKILYK